METTGVLAFQGGFDAHRKMLETLDCPSIAVKETEDLARCERLIIPGGESTVMMRLLGDSVFRKELQRFIREGMPVFGTCAGLILLSSGVVGSEQETLGILDCKVRRNAYGRQADSFEAVLNWKEQSLPGVFIRAPLIEQTGPDCETLIHFEDKAVLVRQDNILAASFHPELSDSTLIHELFLKM